KRADRFSSKGASKWTRGTTSKPDKSEHACVWSPRTCSCSEVGLRVEATRPEKAGKRAHRLKNRPPPNQTKPRFPSELFLVDARPLVAFRPHAMRRGRGIYQ